jgi:hypothetical protein
MRHILPPAISRLLGRRAVFSRQRRAGDTDTKKADVAEHPQVFDHAGLLIDEPSGRAELLFIESSDDFRSNR